MKYILKGRKCFHWQLVLLISPASVLDVFYVLYAVMVMSRGHELNAALGGFGLSVALFYL